MIHCIKQVGRNIPYLRWLPLVVFVICCLLSAHWYIYSSQISLVSFDIVNNLVRGKNPKNVSFSQSPLLYEISSRQQSSTKTVMHSMNRSTSHASTVVSTQAATTIAPKTTTIAPKTTTIAPKTTTMAPESTTKLLTKLVTKLTTILSQNTTPIKTISTTIARRPTTHIEQSHYDDSNSQSSCPFQEVDPFDPAIMNHVNIKKPLQCKGGLPSLVYLKNDSLQVNFTKVNETGKKLDYCNYTPIEFGKDDSRLNSSRWSPKFLSKPIQLSATDEHLLVQCYSNDTVVSQTFKGRVIEKPKVEEKRQADYKVHMKENAPVESLNVLIVGIDGMSKQNLVRTMPKTRNFIIDRLNAKELYKFNKVGDNTFPNVLVLHTGQNENDLLTKRKFVFKNEYFDRLEDLFIWHDYQKAGYRTLMNFDVTWMTAYHYLKKGWKNPTFDYYTRSLRLKIEDVKKLSRKAGENCVGNTPELLVLQDYVLQMVSLFNNTKDKPYFSYNFFTKLTHYVQNDASKGDEIYLKFFKELEQGNVLHNTVVVFFSDHGTRFTGFRHTFNGKIEINTPYMFFMFPPWFEKKYPDVMDAFKTNQNRLTSFFDVHKTLKDLITFNGKTKKGNISSRAISLFDQIPIERNCTHADIPMQYCNCKVLSNASVPEMVKADVSKALLVIIVNKTQHKRNICAVLGLKSISSILVMKTEEKGKRQLSYFQVTIVTKPGDAVYESLMKYDTETREASIVGSIVRLNLYRGQDACVDTLTLKPYCFCKS